jgi:hypothetical protein
VVILEVQGDFFSTRNGGEVTTPCHMMFEKGGQSKLSNKPKLERGV